MSLLLPTLLLACHRTVAFPPAVDAAPVAVIGKDVDFVVEGRTRKEVRASMHDISQLLGLDPDDPHAIAATRWSVQWDYDDVLRDDVCALSSVRVTLHVVEIVPRWDAPAKAAPALVDEWGRFAAGVKVHEDGHTDLAKRAAEDVRTSLAAIGPLPTCDDLAGEVDRVGHARMADWSARQQAYDDETNHGITQSGGFPP